MRYDIKKILMYMTVVLEVIIAAGMLSADMCLGAFVFVCIAVLETILLNMIY